MTLHCLQRLPEIPTRLVQNNGNERFPDTKWSFCSLPCLQPWLLPGRHLGCRMEQVCPSMWHPKLESYPSSMESPWRHQLASHLSGRCIPYIYIYIYRVYMHAIFLFAACPETCVHGGSIVHEASAIWVGLYNWFLGLYKFMFLHNILLIIALILIFYPCTCIDIMRAGHARE